MHTCYSVWLPSVVYVGGIEGTAEALFNAKYDIVESPCGGFHREIL